MEELNEIEEIEYDGEIIPVFDHEIINNADHHAVKFTAIDGREFEAPLQGYNEQSGEFWAVLWDDIIPVPIQDIGLMPKYIIRKTNGKPLHPGAKYFVLRYDEFQNDKIHMEACKKALLTYADEIKKHLPVLSKEIKEAIQ